MNQALLKEMMEYIRRMEEAVDGEWGECRDADELEKEGKLPELFYKLKNTLEVE